MVPYEAPVVWFGGVTVGWLVFVWGVELIDEKIERWADPYLALDGRRLMGGHNNQPKVVVDGEGGVGEEKRPGRNVWGTLSHCLGCRMERQKIEIKKYIVALDGRRLTIYYTTTNQKQAAATEGTMKGRRDEREARGKHDTIVFGRHYS